MLDHLHNVRRPDELEAFDLLGPNGVLLFTTRDAAIAETYASSVHFLSSLSTDQARELLARWAGVNDNEIRSKPMRYSRFLGVSLSRLQ
jgi:hypothetical protein